MEKPSHITFLLAYFGDHAAVVITVMPIDLGKHIPGLGAGERDMMARGMDGVGYVGA